MFQFLRRVSGSLLPRPDRPWRDDATSHAPTIGRKRRYSQDDDDDDDTASAAKKTKNDAVECDAASEGEGPKGELVPPVEGQEVKAVTKGVKEVDLEDEDKEDTPSIQPEGVPLPDSPSGSPAPASESPGPDAVEETKDEEHVGDEDSVASSIPEDGAEEEVEAEAVTENIDASPDGSAPAQEIAVAAVELAMHDIPDALEVKA